MRDIKKKRNIQSAYVSKVCMCEAPVKFAIAGAVEFHVLMERHAQTMAARYSVKASLLAG